MNQNGMPADGNHAGLIELPGSRAGLWANLPAIGLRIDAALDQRSSFLPRDFGDQPVIADGSRKQQVAADVYCPSVPMSRSGSADGGMLSPAFIGRCKE